MFSCYTLMYVMCDVCDVRECRGLVMGFGRAHVLALMCMLGTDVCDVRDVRDVCDAFACRGWVMGFGRAHVLDSLSLSLSLSLSHTHTHTHTLAGRIFWTAGNKVFKAI
jgi:hypothetical protein